MINENSQSSARSFSAIQASAAKFKPEASAKQFEMRMHDSDGMPDDDLPAFDRDTPIVEVGAAELCLCQIGGLMEDDSEALPTASPKPTPSPSIPPPLPIASAVTNNVTGLVLVRLPRGRLVNDCIVLLALISNQNAQLYQSEAGGK